MGTSTPHDFILSPANVLGALPDLAGEPVNLLPVALLNQPLRVQVPHWRESGGLAPPRVQLYWEGALVLDQVMPPGFDDDDLVFSLAALPMDHGTHRLHYQVRLGNGSVEEGAPTAVNVDRVPPALGVPPPSLQLPGEVLGGLTDDYLQAHGDQLQAVVPPYAGQAPGDRIEWYWDTQPGAEDSAGSLRVADLVPPMTLTLAGALVRERGDGTRFVYYRITDYAGNTSQSAITSLPVQATPVPRVLPVLHAVGATGSGARQTLKAIQVTTGLELEVPATAVIKPGETAVLIFGTPGQVGGARLPIQGAGTQVNVGVQAVAPHLDRTVSVYYEVTDTAGEVHTSDVLTLALTESSGLNFPTVQCELVDGNQLSLRQVPASGAPITLAAWRMMTTDQHLMVRVEGIDTSGAPLDEPVVQGRPVTAAEVGTGVGHDGGLVVPRALLLRLQRNMPFYVRGYLSFDGSDQWPAMPTFKDLVPTLVS
jgi:hypothetical protein